MPASATRRGPNRVTLDFAWAESPRQVFPDPASRAVIGSTGVVSPVNIDVHSFDEAFISLFGADGAEVKASSGRRGYNVTVIDPRTGKVIEMRSASTPRPTPTKRMPWPPIWPASRKGASSRSRPRATRAPT